CGDVALGVRWIHDPALGIPRSAFQVSRRPADPQPPTREIVPPATPVTAPTSLQFSELYELVVIATPRPGSTMELRATSSDNTPIPGQTVVLSVPTAVWLSEL